MRIRRDKSYAILTGDIVDSTRLSPERRRLLPRAIDRCGKAIQRAFGSACPLELDTFRGDGWQLVVTAPTLALRIALFFRAALRIEMDSAGVDSRVSIGIGTIDFIPGERTAEGDGDAYRRSGRGLDQLGRRERLRVDLAGTADADDLRFLDAAVVLTDALAISWTPSQSRALLGAMIGETQARIASRWKPSAVSQQAVAQHLDRARWYAVERALIAFERDHVTT